MVLFCTGERRKKELRRKVKEVKEESRDYALYSTWCIEQRVVTFVHVRSACRI